MRPLIGIPDDKLRLVLDRQRLIVGVYAGRLILSAAIFVAAVFVWRAADELDTLIASLTFAASVVFTAGSIWRSMAVKGQLTETFLYLQVIFDVLVVTAVVHVTGSRQPELSFFAALYVVVNAVAGLLLPRGGSLLIAVFGSALYALDVLVWSESGFSPAAAFQVSVFIGAALVTGVIASRLQQMSAITPQLAAELTQARLEAADILSNIRSGILTTDAAGLLLYANPAASELLTLDLQALAGRDVLGEIARVAPGLAAAIRRAADEHRITQREETVVQLPNREFPIGVTTTANDGDAAGVGRSVTAIFQDISDQKRLDLLRRRAERLEAVAELSASLAHEIRNPLASIRSAVEQLGRSPRATADEQTLSRLIVRESDRLSRLLSEFLDFARTRVTRIGTVDIVALVRGAAKLASTHPSRAEGVTVACVAPDRAVVIEGDEDLLHRAVFNLLLNAVQAAPPNGRACIEVGNGRDVTLPAGVELGDDAVAIVVTDNGPGIDPSIRERLFQPFTTTKSGGSGLGLPVAHRAIEAHRGVVLVDSDEGGTRFTVVLPRTQKPSPVTHGAAA